MQFSLRLLTVILLARLSSVGAYAQATHEPFRVDTGSQPLYPGNVVAIVFDKNLATYQWDGVLRFNTTTSSFSFSLNEQFRSRIIQTRRKLIRDEQSLDVKAKHQWFHRSVSFFPGLAGTVQVKNFILSDDQKFSDSQRSNVTSASSNGFYGGVEAEVFENFFIEPLIGIRYDNQVGVRDNGASFVVSAWSPEGEFGGYQTTITGRFQRDHLHPRTLENRSIIVGIEKNFFERTRNVLQANYFFNQRDFYFPADSLVFREFQAANNIERRAERVLALSNLLEYNIGDRFLVSFHGNLSSRLIDRVFRYRPLANPPSNTLVNTGVDEFKIGGSAHMVYTAGDDFTAAAQLLISERDERHSVGPDERISSQIDTRARVEAQKDHLSRRTMAASNFIIALSRSDRIFFSGSTSLLRYDTPSSENVEDRDELWYSFNLTTLHQMNSHLYLRVTTDISLTHLVYINRLRSANNTWNRVFRLAPRLTYVPLSDFSTTNTFEVLANYTVYDFENRPSVQVKSFSFRQFSFIDSTRFAITSRFALEGFSHIRLYQQGELRWDAFTERPVNYFEDKTIIGRVEYAFERRLLLSIGVRYFSQIRFGYVGGKRIFETLLRRIGPLGMLRCQLSERAQVAIDGWYERQVQTNGFSRGFTNMTMSLNVRL